MSVVEKDRNGSGWEDESLSLEKHSKKKTKTKECTQNYIHSWQSNKQTNKQTNNILYDTYIEHIHNLRIDISYIQSLWM